MNGKWEWPPSPAHSPSSPVSAEGSRRALLNKYNQATDRLHPTGALQGGGRGEEEAEGERKGQKENSNIPDSKRAVLLHPPDTTRRTHTRGPSAPADEVVVKTESKTRTTRNSTDAGRPTRWAGSSGQGQQCQQHMKPCYP